MCLWAYAVLQSTFLYLAAFPSNRSVARNARHSERRRGGGAPFSVCKEEQPEPEPAGGRPTAEKIGRPDARPVSKGINEYVV